MTAFKRMWIIVVAVVGLCGCAVPESVRQEAIANCLQVGISESDRQFPICARSYGLQRQEGALNQNFKNEYDASENDRAMRRRRDIFR